LDCPRKRRKPPRSLALDDVNGGTRVTITHTGVPAESGPGRGWNGAFDKLAAELRAVTGN
jgi:hypothetical protein